MNSAKAATPTVTDQALQMSLSNAAKNMAYALAELRAASAKAQESCGALEIDGALDQVRYLEKELEQAKKMAINGELRPLPGESVSLLLMLLRLCCQVKNHLVI